MKKNLVILYGPLLHYRVPLFNELSKDYNVTVITSGYKGYLTDLQFRLIVERPHRIWRFWLQFGVRGKVFSGGYDVCVIFVDIAWLAYLSLIFFPARCKTIVWGAWRTKSKIANWLRLEAIRASDSAIFYSNAHLEDFAAAGAKKDKLFVAHNTVKVLCSLPAHSCEDKDIILFVGSLDHRKGNDLLIQVFSDIRNSIPQYIKLVFIGSGSQEQKLKSLVDYYDLCGRVGFVGRINEDIALEPFYRRAIVSVSLKQAGLSVLQSMGFGVPFMTTRECVSGGENLNIVQGVNGVICDLRPDAIGSELVRLCNDISFARTLGKNAYSHYIQYCTIQNYARGFYDAIEGERRSLVWRGGARKVSPRA